MVGGQLAPETLTQAQVFARPEDWNGSLNQAADAVVVHRDDRVGARRAPQDGERPLQMVSPVESPSAYVGCAFRPVIGVAMSWPIVCLELAVKNRPPDSGD